MRETATDEISALKAELEALRREKETLANQVKRLVQAEGKLYAYQEELDAKLKEYQDLYHLNRKLSGTFNLSAVFKEASAYIINTLGFERVLFLCRPDGQDAYSVCALEGYYEDQEKTDLSNVSLSVQEPSLAPIVSGGEYRICSGGCQDDELLALRHMIHMDEFLLYPLRSQGLLFAFLIVGNTAGNASFYHGITDAVASSPAIGNLVGLLSSIIENNVLYAQMEKALEQERLAEGKYRGIFENAMDGIYRSTPDGRIISCNPATANILGYESTEELIGTIDDIGRDIYGDPQRRRDMVEMVKNHIEVKDLELEFRRKDGSSVWVLLSARPTFENGELAYIDGIFKDITDQKRIEDALTKLSQAVEQSPVTIVITDTRGRIEFVNPKFVQLTGYTREEVVGKSSSLLKTEYNSPEMYRSLWQTITSGNVWEGEFVNRKKNGELFSERATISPIKNKEGVTTHYLAIKEDITERKQLEAQLLQSQKMESVGRLAGGVAHDFNNMLSVIIGCAQLAMFKVPEGDQVWQYLNQISRAAQRSSEITRQLLAFSRKEIISPKKVNLNAKVVEMQSTLGRLIGEDINLTFKPAQNLWSIQADPSQLDQILVNLGVNARDAMPGGGSLAIETSNVHIDATYCKYHLDAKPGDYVQLVVSDSGIGMEQEILTHIFEPFFTTKEVGKGTGLGLATVYGIIRQNNGFINVYSEPNYGTSFQLHFPRYVGAAEADTEAPELEMTGSGTVLLVEDDPLVREMASQMLEEIGYTVMQTRSPFEAIEICKKTNPGIDVILTDVVMPGMNGKEMVEEIQTFRPDMKVLFMSGYTSDLVAQRGVVDEGRHFIQKPFDIHSLNKKIRETLND